MGLSRQLSVECLGLGPGRLAFGFTRLGVGPSFEGEVADSAILVFDLCGFVRLNGDAHQAKQFHRCRGSVSHLSPHEFGADRGTGDG